MKKNIWWVTHALSKLELEGTVNKGQSNESCKFHDGGLDRQDEHPCLNSPPTEEITLGLAELRLEISEAKDDSLASLRLGVTTGP